MDKCLSNWFFINDTILRRQQRTSGSGVTGVPDALRCRNRWDALATDDDDALKTYSRIYFYCTLSILFLCLLLSIAGTTKAVEIVSFALLLGIS